MPLYHGDPIYKWEAKKAPGNKTKKVSTPYDNPYDYQGKLEPYIDWVRFEYKKGSSNKFWEVRIRKSGDWWMPQTRYGKIGTSGKIWSGDNYYNCWNAKEFVEKKISKKLGKGYIQVVLSITAGKFAKEKGITPAAVRAAISAAGLEPAKVEGGCAYYSRASLEALLIKGSTKKPTKKKSPKAPKKKPKPKKPSIKPSGVPKRTVVDL